MSRCDCDDLRVADDGTVVLFHEPDCPDVPQLPFGEGDQT